MDDRELLERAAKSVGLTIWKHGKNGGGFINDRAEAWSPLTNDGDAFRLAVALKVQIIIHNDWVEGLIDGIQLASPQNCYSSDCCMCETTRRAVVMAAARSTLDL